MQIKIGQLALADIDAIWIYTNDQWSEEQAIRYYDLILDEIELLARYPESGKVVESVGPGYRYLQVKSHLLFYKVDFDRNVIEVIRVLHERMNSTQWLP